MRGWLARLIRLILFVALVAGIVVGAQYLPEHLTEALALFLLLPILGIAIRWGMPEAIITALAASFFFDYFFLPPLGTLGPQTLSDWVTTATFLTVAISTSRLSTQARRRAREATARRVEMERLYMFGQATLQSGSLEATIHTGLEQILDIFGGDGVAFHDAASDRIVRAGKESARLADADLREVTRTEARRADAGSSTAIVPVRLGDVRIGSLGFVGAVFTDTTVTAVGHRLGVALERTRALEKEGAAESARKAQELKSTVLDALAHGVKTPLTTIRLAASSLLSQPQGAAPHQLELLEAIDQEATRLQLFVDEALQLAQIDAGLLRMEKEFHDVRALIDASIGDLQAAMQGRAVEVTCAGDLPAAPFDFRLLKLVLRNCSPMQTNTARRPRRWWSARGCRRTRL